jgi:hypothetical protein
MDRGRPSLDRLMAEVAARQATMAKAVADVQARTRAEVERLRADEPPPQPQVDADEYDQTESWMVTGYTTPPAPRSHVDPARQEVLSKLESGVLTWKDVFSDTPDPAVRALRGFLDERIDEVRRVRNGG